MDKKIAQFLCFAGLFAAFAQGVSAQFYNGSQQDFGKNRIQYKNYLWQYYPFDKFQTYFYEGGKNLAIYTARTAKTHLAELEEMFEYKLEDPVEFVVYNKLQDFRQSNVGLSVDEGYNIGGVTRIVGSKIFLYYEGDHKSLDAQIRSGLTTILLNQMIYGGNWKETLKNSTLLSLPEWYLKGLTSYAANSWNTELDDKARDGILSGDYDKFNRLYGEDARIAGHSLWNYIAEVYGENVIPNILYMTRMSKNLESGFLFVIGISLKTLSSEYLEYYKKRYESDKIGRLAYRAEKLNIPSKKHRTYHQFNISPDGRYATYVTNQLGKYKIFLHDLSKNKSKRIYRREHKLNRIIDPSFPVIAWHPTGAGFAFVTEEKGKVWMTIHTVSTQKNSKRELFNLDKVLYMAYNKSGRSMVMSAVNKGQTDLYVYNVIGNQQKQLTNDLYDDLYPSFIDEGERIIFSSNRSDDTLRSDTKIEPLSPFLDLFVYDFATRSNILKRITTTPYANETYPAQYDTINYTYLSDKTGITNRYIAKYDSVISHIDTALHYRYFTESFPLSNGSRNILEYKIHAQQNRYGMLVFRNGKYEFRKGRINNDSIIGEQIAPTEYRVSFQNLMALYAGEKPVDTTEINSITTIKVFDNHPKDDHKIDIDNYRFDDDKEDENDRSTSRPAANEAIVLSDTTKNKKPEFTLPRPGTYRLNFATDYVVTQVDNSFMNTAYQRFNGSAGSYYNPGFNGLLKLGISDLFEDHRLIGAMRLSGNFDSNEYYLAYHDLSKRMDKTYLFHRQSLLSVADFSVIKNIMNEVKYLVKFPFSEVASLRTTFNYRYDQSITLSSDINTLRDPTTIHHLGSAKLEYIFDNTIPKGLNLYHGTRFKIFAEYYRELDQKETDFKVAGIDFRHYQKIHRDMIFAARLAAGTSWGSQRLVHYMGGVDNWLIPKFDNSIPIANDQGYAFQTIATPVRGFFQNARNGNNFALVNTEVRWPIFKYFLNRPIRSDFIENFQAIGFGDMGTAFTGTNPYSENNTFNTQVIYQNPLTITIQNQREPIIWGYGFGLRTRVWGYFVRADWAWGVDDGVVLDSLFYLSLSLDF